MKMKNLHLTAAKLRCLHFNLTEITEMVCLEPQPARPEWWDKISFLLPTYIRSSRPNQKEPTYIRSSRPIIHLDSYLIKSKVVEF